MDHLLVLVSILLILTMAIDVVWTTISTNGGGPVTRVVARSLWTIARQLHRLTGRQELLTAAGPAILVGTVIAWISMLFAGYLIAFSIAPEEIVQSTTRVPAELTDRVYFTGFTLFTLGTGDFEATSTRYRLLMALGALQGLFFITLCITYLLPVVSAVKDKRTLAILIRGMGQTPQDILLNGWNGESFADLETPMLEVAKMTASHGQHHLVYPVLHYFFSGDASHALPLQFAIWYEAIWLLRHAVEPSVRPTGVYVRTSHVTAESFLDLVHEGFTKKLPKQSVPQPHIDALRNAGIPLVSDVEQVLRDARTDAYRERAAATAEDQGWTWEQVTQRHGRTRRAFDTHALLDGDDS